MLGQGGQSVALDCWRAGAGLHYKASRHHANEETAWMGDDIRVNGVPWTRCRPSPVAAKGRFRDPRRDFPATNLGAKPAVLASAPVSNFTLTQDAGVKAADVANMSLSDDFTSGTLPMAAWATAQERPARLGAAGPA